MKLFIEQFEEEIKTIGEMKKYYNYDEDNYLTLTATERQLTSALEDVLDATQTMKHIRENFEATQNTVLEDTIKELEDAIKESEEKVKDEPKKEWYEEEVTIAELLEMDTNEMTEFIVNSYKKFLQ